jgi:phosphohistidine swiveling domain-containing protein
VYDRVADRKVGDNVINYLTSITDEKEIVLLNNNRTVKALTDRIKQTRSLESDFGKAVEKSKKLITEDMVRHHAVALTRWKRFLVNTGIDKKLSHIKDTKIAEVIVPAQSTLDQYDVFNASLKALSYFRYNAHWNLPTIDTANLGDLTETLDKKYPLVGALDTWRLDTDGVDHLIKYFNVIHEESTP